MIERGGGWAVYKAGGDGDSPGEVHVTPTGDVIDHHLSGDCKCGPKSDPFPGRGPGVRLVTHRPADGREANE